MLEIILAMKSQKNNKATGHDNLNAEIFKADPILAAIYQPLFEEIWRKKQILIEWTKGVIFKILKKSKLHDCNN